MSLAEELEALRKQYLKDYIKLYKEYSEATGAEKERLRSELGKLQARYLKEQQHLKEVKSRLKAAEQQTEMVRKESEEATKRAVSKLERIEQETKRQLSKAEEQTERSLNVIAGQARSSLSKAEEQTKKASETAKYGMQTIIERAEKATHSIPDFTAAFTKGIGEVLKSVEAMINSSVLNWIGSTLAKALLITPDSYVETMKAIAEGQRKLAGELK